MTPCKIEVGYGLQALVSPEDYDQVAAYKWWIEPRDATCYARALIHDHPLYMHRFLLPALPPLVIDHIDGWGLNNQRHNLRAVNQSQNVRNPHPCRFKNVRRHPKNLTRWQYYDYTFNTWAGSYRTAFDAALASDWEAVRLNQPDLLNFPRHFAQSYGRDYPSLPTQ